MARYRTSAALLLFAASLPALATSSAPWTPDPACVEATRDALYSLGLPGADALAADVDGLAASFAASAPAERADQREVLAAFALTLRDIRYRRGGRAPKTGFDCSGFVQYVYAKALGVDLPNNSLGQFNDGTRVSRTDLRIGDLVFFRIHGKRVSHVGIYVGDGRFIHSPSTGKHVRVDSLGDGYWTRRYAGARRPDVLT
jgi:cell wall-associated NlpC family hydrolase